MALTFTKRFSRRMGDRKFRIYEITHDASATTIDAADIGLNYIDYAVVHGKFALSAVSDFTYLSGDAFGPFVNLNAALTATTIDIIEAWGY